ncbi:NAD(+) diphosphatase [Mangrovibacterium sp.]|uniref:NAD(+) diphosphatase n=1 Tax=Mangrovibacterium sp. TaxID=1961364 RepID=UPI0035633807
MIQDIFPHRFNNQYLANQRMNEADWVFHFRGNELLVKIEGNTVVLPQRKDFPELSEQTPATFLFQLNERSCFLITNLRENSQEGLEYKDMSFFRTIDQPEVAWVAVAAFQLKNWYALNKFCGQCGSPTKHKTDERALMCPACKTVFFPKISPAIIVAILSNDKILLARNASFTGNRFALIAGYVDVGETIEQAVRREIKEEVGLSVTNIRYYDSQPWPLSGSLMIGFIAEADEEQPIVIDNKEIVEAGWFSRGNLPNHPNTSSIAGELIARFERGELLSQSFCPTEEQMR